MDYFQLGLLDYPSCLKLMTEAHKAVACGLLPNFVLLVEHPHVITLGKNALLSDVLANQAELGKHGFTLIRTDRGGQVTMHLPGQLVAYPIIKMQNALHVRQYVTSLEESCIHYLAQHGIKAKRNPCCPGIYTADEKIASIGIRIKDSTSMHGLAINISSDLELFRLILPCGSNTPMTSVEKIIQKKLNMTDEAKSFATSFSEIFSVTPARIHTKEELIIRLTALASQ